MKEGETNGKIGNEAKLILKLAKERAKPSHMSMPYDYKENSELRGAYNLGVLEGLRIMPHLMV